MNGTGSASVRFVPIAGTRHLQQLRLNAGYRLAFGDYVSASVVIATGDHVFHFFFGRSAWAGITLR